MFGGIFKKIKRDEEGYLIIKEGGHTLWDEKVKCYGKSEVTIRGESEAIAKEFSVVYAHDNSVVHAYDNSKVYGYGKDVKIFIYSPNCFVKVEGGYKVYYKIPQLEEKRDRYGYITVKEGEYDIYNDKVRCLGNSKVKTYGMSLVFAEENAIVYAHDESVVYAYDNSTVYAYDKAEVKAYNESIVYIYGKNMITTTGRATVHVCEGGKRLDPKSEYEKKESKIWRLLFIGSIIFAIIRLIKFVFTYEPPSLRVDNKENKNDFTKRPPDWI
jgi:hypothetical protein